MNDEQVIFSLREKAPQLTPIQLTDYCANLIGKPFSQGMVVTYFKRAFPNCPLGKLLTAREWVRFGGPMSDDEFDLLLKPYIGKAATVVSLGTSDGEKAC